MGGDRCLRQDRYFFVKNVQIQDCIKEPNLLIRSKVRFVCFHLDQFCNTLCGFNVILSDRSDQKAFFKGIQLFQIFDLSIALDLFIISKEPVIYKALFHFIRQKWLDNILEIFLVFEVNE